MTLANKITIIRMFFVPVFLLLLAVPLRHQQLIALIIFVLFFFGDFLDGHFARRRNEVTNLGKFLDPLADKLMIGTALIYLTGIGQVPAWVTYLIIGREILITGIRTILAQEKVAVPASKSGKLKTVIQAVSIGLILLNNNIFYPIIYLALIITIYSGLEYLFNLRKSLKSFFNRFF